MTLLGDLLDLVNDLSSFDERSFRRWQYEIVERYRRSETDQEPIAVAITSRNLRECDAVTRARLEELLAMLDHVHDPMITAVVQSDCWAS